MEILLKCKERIFYCEVDNSFVGIRRKNCEPMNDIIKKRISKEVRIEELRVEIDAIDQYLCERSASSFDPMPTRIEWLLGDNRLAEIRENYEIKVVERFMENYMKAFKDFSSRMTASQENQWLSSVSLITNSKLVLQLQRIGKNRCSLSSSSIGCLRCAWQELLLADISSMEEATCWFRTETTTKSGTSRATNTFEKEHPREKPKIGPKWWTYLEL